MRIMGRFGVLLGLVAASLSMACGPSADGSTEEGSAEVGAPGNDGANSTPVAPAETLKPQKVKQHVD